MIKKCFDFNFMQHCIKLAGDKLQILEDLKGIDLFNIEQGGYQI